jgi:hypothetical protein
MERAKNDELKKLSAFRRRWIWPAYGAAVAIGALTALVQAEAGWILLLTLMLAVGSLHLAILARDYALRREFIESVLFWMMAGFAALGGIVSLVAWWRMLTIDS